MNNFKMSIPTATHATAVLHVQGQPAPVILDENEMNLPRYDAFMKDHLEDMIKATEIFEKETNGKIIPRGIVITISLRTPNDFMEFVIIPDDEFVTELIASKRLHFGNSKGVLFFHMDFDTKPIENVWQPTE